MWLERKRRAKAQNRLNEAIGVLYDDRQQQIANGEWSITNGARTNDLTKADEIHKIGYILVRPVTCAVTLDKTCCRLLYLPALEKRP